MSAVREQHAGTTLVKIHSTKQLDQTRKKQIGLSQDGGQDRGIRCGSCLVDCCTSTPV